jgi:hypothetical protein
MFWSFKYIKRSYVATIVIMAGENDLKCPEVLEFTGKW